MAEMPEQKDTWSLHKAASIVLLAYTTKRREREGEEFCRHCGLAIKEDNCIFAKLRAALAAAPKEKANIEIEILARAIHQEWRDGMVLEQGRKVSPERVQWETMDERDRELDRFIASRLLKTFSFGINVAAPGTPPEEVPDHWRCQACGQKINHDPMGTAAVCESCSAAERQKGQGE